MSKDFTDVTFDALRFKKELDQFRDLLTANQNLGERQLQTFFKASLHLTCHIGTIVSVGVARQVAYEFEIMGDYGADIVFVNRERQFCFVELEDGCPDSVLESVGKKSTKEWSRRFEHGFSQIVDWFAIWTTSRKPTDFIETSVMGILVLSACY